MIRVAIGRHHTESNILVSLLLDLAGTWNTDTIGIEKQSRHHRRLIRRLAPVLLLVGLIDGERMLYLVSGRWSHGIRMHTQQRFILQMSTLGVAK